MGKTHTAEILRAHLVKAAAPSTALKKFVFKDAITKGVGLAAGGALIGTGIAAAASGYDALHRGISSSSRFKAMMKRNPDLKDKPVEDVREMFDIVHDYSPDLTRSPAVAGAFVRRALEYKDVGVAPASVKELADINLSLSKAKGEKGGYSGLLRNVGMTAAGRMD